MSPKTTRPALRQEGNEEEQEEKRERANSHYLLNGNFPAQRDLYENTLAPPSLCIVGTVKYRYINSI